MLRRCHSQHRTAFVRDVDYRNAVKGLRQLVLVNFLDENVATWNQLQQN